jgi:hypothetical protein
MNTYVDIPPKVRMDATSMLASARKVEVIAGAFATQRSLESAKTELRRVISKANQILRDLP